MHLVPVVNVVKHFFSSSLTNRPVKLGHLLQLSLSRPGKGLTRSLPQRGAHVKCSTRVNSGLTGKYLTRLGRLFRALVSKGGAYPSGSFIRCSL